MNKNSLNLIFVILLFCVLGCVCPPPKNESRSNVKTSPTEMSKKEQALIQNEITVKATKAGFGSVFMADVTVKNLSAVTTKDFTVECELFGNSGTLIDTVSETIYESVPPKQTKTFKEINFGFAKSQATRFSCKLTDLDTF